MSDSLAQLRTELKSENIPFKNYHGFEGAQELTKIKTGEHIMILYNKDITNRDIPNELVQTDNLTIYYFPKAKSLRKF